jgi:hypothetical protein
MSRTIRRMLRLSEDEDRRLVAHAKDAGLEPAVYARRRAIAEPPSPRPRAVTQDVLFHANRAAQTLSEMAEAAADVGDVTGARKLDAAAAQLSEFMQRLTNDPKGQ